MNSYEFDYLYTGNRNFPIEFKFPLSKGECQKMPSLEGRLALSSACYEYVLASIGGYLACINASDKSVLWEYRQEGRAGIRSICDAEGIFATLNDSSVASLDKSNGRELWKFGQAELWSLSKNYVFVLRSESNNQLLICLDRENGQEIWRIEKIRGFQADVFSYDNLVISQDAEGIYALNGETGEINWELTTTLFLEENFKQELENWRKRPGGAGSFAPKIPLSRLGCLSEGKVFLSWDVGVVAALDIATGNLLWSWKFPAGHELNIARSIIYKNSKIFFHNDQHRGKNSYLFCLDANTGETVFKSDKRITNEGCANAIIAGQYFIGASGNSLAFWDINDLKMVWSYTHKGDAIFNSPANLFNKGLVFADSQKKCLQWFYI